SVCRRTTNGPLPRSARRRTAPTTSRATATPVPAGSRYAPRSRQAPALVVGRLPGPSTWWATSRRGPWTATRGRTIAAARGTPATSGASHSRRRTRRSRGTTPSAFAACGRQALGALLATSAEVGLAVHRHDGGPVE